MTNAKVLMSRENKLAGIWLISTILIYIPYIIILIDIGETNVLKFLIFIWNWFFNISPGIFNFFDSWTGILDIFGRIIGAAICAIFFMLVFICSFIVTGFPILTGGLISIFSEGILENKKGKVVLSGFFSIICILLIFAIYVDGKLRQAEILAKIFDPAHPPILKADIQFDDAQGLIPNGVLDAGEKASLVIGVINKGEGRAFNLGLEMDASSVIGVQVNPSKKIYHQELKPEENIKIVVPIKAGINIKQGLLKVEAKITEQNGNYSNPMTLELALLPLISPDIKVVRASMVGDNEGVLPKSDGRASLMVEIMNTGAGVALNTIIEWKPSIYLTHQTQPAIIPIINSYEDKKLIFENRLPRRTDYPFISGALIIKEKRLGTIYQQKYEFPFINLKPDLNISAIFHDINGGPTLEPQELGVLRIQIINTGGLEALNIEVKPEIKNKNVVLREPLSQNVPILSPFLPSSELDFSFLVKGSAEPGPLEIDINVNQSDFPPMKFIVSAEIFASEPKMTLATAPSFVLTGGVKQDVVMDTIYNVRSKGEAVFTEDRTKRQVREEAINNAMASGIESAMVEISSRIVAKDYKMQSYYLQSDIKGFYLKQPTVVNERLFREGEYDKIAVEIIGDVMLRFPKK